jgi:succinate dehydrogenase/fumarate reductase flavoprotein subunit
MAAFVEGRKRPEPAPARLAPTVAALGAPLDRPAGAALYDLQQWLRDVMWERAGLVRDAVGLEQALAEIERLEAGLDAVGVVGDPGLNTAWQDWLSLRNQTVAARLIAASALERCESRGAHFRRDFPAPAAGAPMTVRVRRGAGGPAVTTAPVALTRASPGGAAVPATVEVGD